MIGGCSARSAASAAGGVGGGGGGSGALSRGDPLQGVQQYPEPARNRAKEPETPYIIGVFRAFRSSRQKSKFIKDNMPQEAFRGRITPNFDISLRFCLFFQKNGVPLYQMKGGTLNRENLTNHQYF